MFSTNEKAVTVAKSTNVFNLKELSKHEMEDHEDSLDDLLFQEDFAHCGDCAAEEHALIKLDYYLFVSIETSF